MWNNFLKERSSFSPKFKNQMELKLTFNAAHERQYYSPKLSTNFGKYL